MEKFTSTTGVHNALGEHARQGKCGKCGDRQKLVYPWPLPGLGEYCAACVVVQSGGRNSA